MILGLSHINLYCSDLTKIAQDLRAQGFELQFSALDIPNPKNKAAFSQLKCNKHSIHFFKHSENINIEVVVPEELAHPSNRWINPGTTEIELRTANPEKTSQFLSQFGLRPLEQNRLDFYDLLKKRKYTIQLSPGEIIPPPLDRDGFGCLTFLTSKLERELNRLLNEGFEVSSPEKLTVGPNQVEIGFVKGLSGEIIELIELQNGRR
jgi:hypothetical protein